MTNKSNPTPLGILAAEKGLMLDPTFPIYSSHEDEQAAFEQLIRTSEVVANALLAHPPGSVAPILGWGHWVTEWEGALYLVGASLNNDFMDEDARFIQDVTGLSAAELKELEAAMAEWLTNRMYLEFGVERLNALVLKSYSPK